MLYPSVSVCIVWQQKKLFTHNREMHSVASFRVTYREYLPFRVMSDYDSSAMQI